MTFKVSDNQYGQPHPNDSWASCFVIITRLKAIRHFKLPSKILLPPGEHNELNAAATYIVSEIPGSEIRIRKCIIIPEFLDPDLSHLS